MWPVAIGAGALLLGIGKVIIDAIEEEADDRRREWRHRSRALAAEAGRCNRELEHRLTSAAQSVEFQRLRNLHWESCKKAQELHTQLQEGRGIHRKLNRALGQAAKDKAALRQTIGNASGEQRREARQALQQLNAFRQKLFDERTATAEANEHLLAQVQTLNQNTHALKLHIRERCGHGGRVWFKRIEGRKQTNSRS